MDTQTQCPCGQQRPLQDCCGRFIAGRELPDSAEELMRSRYTAFAIHQVDYLIESHHPETRGEVSRDEVKRFSEGLAWRGLEILETVDGQADDDQGWVEFAAHFREHNEDRVHHERSLFRRYQGRWFFHSVAHPERTPVQRTQPKVGRNEPCPCGSGKKYKKCCAAKEGAG
jgi:SEC-C motif-containing protein